MYQQAQKNKGPFYLCSLGIGCDLLYHWKKQVFRTEGGSCEFESLFSVVSKLLNVSPGRSWRMCRRGSGIHLFLSAAHSWERLYCQLLELQGRTASCLVPHSRDAQTFQGPRLHLWVKKQMHTPSPKWAIHWVQPLGTWYRLLIKNQWFQSFLCENKMFLLLWTHQSRHFKNLKECFLYNCPCRGSLPYFLPFSKLILRSPLAHPTMPCLVGLRGAPLTSLQLSWSTAQGDNLVAKNTSLLWNPRLPQDLSRDPKTKGKQDNLQTL